MTADHRTAFVEWARRARAKPTFDLEERDYRLGVSRGVRALIDAAESGGPLRDEALALMKRVMDADVSIVGPGHVMQLVEWAEADEYGLANALRQLSAEDDAVARLARFTAAIEAGPLGGRVAAGGLMVASLLNFGISPETLPAVHLGRYGRLRGLLDQASLDSRSPVETYHDYLAFAHEVERLLKAAAVPVRDMIDVESLITICAVEHELWAGAGDASGSKRTSQPSTYLAMAALTRNQGRYLAEWLEFHRLVGVERFFLYDNESNDDTREVLAPYQEEGTVVVHDWPGSVGESQFILLGRQREAYMDCIRTHRDEARWIAFVDTDEFLFAPNGEPLPELLVAFERWPAVAVGCVMLGTSGHVTPPPGLVTESYIERLPTSGAERWDRRVKSIVDPVAVTGCVNAHAFEYARGTAVDENGYPVLTDTAKSRSMDRLRVNHYYCRSEQEVRTKHRRRSTFFNVDPETSPDSWQRHEGGGDAVVRELCSPGPRDETILKYVPAVRDALAERAVVK